MLKPYNTCRTQCFLQLSEGTPAERAHHEAILAFMSMIDDTEMEEEFEKSPLPQEKMMIVWIVLP